ncbi:hypothetical protein [Luteipulveratus mongoliensis]|uniref:Uncharacterized protein n=1 Tax=Luteipulveratus mongoliensis TaxID=571913 RepID=A0A0K1JH13_9MICO|nr:hypothetical protein [Luteipulveratus mongoliensis]AKU15875.1 hypothetical protein VV02_08440 [Luteipulveratus mongoliensis]
MRSSSLIFLVIVIIWAAYLLQHWVRRREHLATARSVDRFSEGMRVLERRPTVHGAEVPLPTSDGSGRPSVLAAAVAEPRPSLRAGVPMTNDAEPVRPDSRPASADAEGADARQVRGLTLVATVALFLAVVVMTPMGVTPWWSPLVMLVALGGVIGWLRSAAVKAASSAAPAPSQERPARPAPRRTPSQAGRVSGAVAAESVYDVSGPAAATAEPVAAEVPVKTAPAAQLQPGDWEPVAVPPPTYTLKAKAAERAEPAPAATVDDTPVFDAQSITEPEPEQAPEATPAPAPAPSYAEMAVEDLPFDGLALDEDLEDLPPVHRAG